MMGGLLNTGNSKGKSTLFLPSAMLPKKYHQVLSGTVSFVNNPVPSSLKKQTQNSNESIRSSFTMIQASTKTIKTEGYDLLKITYDFWRRCQRTYGWDPYWLDMQMFCISLSLSFSVTLLLFPVRVFLLQSRLNTTPIRKLQPLYLRKEDKSPRDFPYMLVEASFCPVFLSFQGTAEGLDPENEKKKTVTPIPFHSVLQ